MRFTAREEEGKSEGSKGRTKVKPVKRKCIFHMNEGSCVFTFSFYTSFAYLSILGSLSIHPIMRNGCIHWQRAGQCFQQMARTLRLVDLSITT